MPEATLQFSPAYTIVGVYRLYHDPKLWRSMWHASRYSLMRAMLTAGIWTVVTLPLQGYLATWLVGRIGRSIGAEQRVHVPMPSFLTLAKVLLIANQVNLVLYYNVKNQLHKFRSIAYEETVASRGKPASWWIPYQEEWEKPPQHGASAAVSRGVRQRVQRGFLHWITRKAVVIIATSIPVLGALVYSGFTALTYARKLQQPFFEAKHMTPEQVDTWVEERRTSYWLFGMSAMTLEHIPFLGIFFSISNRIGAAMWAHDLEKRQHLYQSGQRSPVAQNDTFQREKLPKEDEPGGYGHPDRPDVDLPGGFAG
ncbi:hypothetical protein MYAM1_002646 [Malassezia yamatoensis]|uniref:Uncharacterized protein n=1 Tax=Malassezia yamatoensis TaxID=253288 RepID=A0AAJ5YTH1_9BASI|nr:hypothetical protein MYAM1_002646 [Malassezia yamatoensis]